MTRLVTIGVAARLTKSPAWQLRAWETSGLLHPARSASGYRLYSPSDIETVLRLRQELSGGHRLQLYGPASEVTRTSGYPSRAAESDGVQGDQTCLRDLVAPLIDGRRISFAAVVELHDDHRCRLSIFAGAETLTPIGTELDAMWARLIRRGYRGPAPLPEPFATLDGVMTYVDDGVGLLVTGNDEEFAAQLALAIRTGLRLIRERRRLAAEVDHWTRRHQAMREIAHAFANETPSSAYLQVLDSTIAVVNATAGAISFANPLRQQYVLAAHRGLSDRYVQGIASWRLTEGLAGRAYGLQEPVLVDDLQFHEGVTREIVRLEQLRSYLGIPLVSASRCFGVLEVLTREPGSFTTEDIKAIQGLVAPLTLAAQAELSKLELSSNRDEQAQVFREWAGQVARASKAQRRELVDALRRELTRTPDDGEADHVYEHWRLLDSRIAALMSNFEALNESRLDLVPALRDFLAPRVSEGTGRLVTVEVREPWTPVLSADTAGKAYLALATAVEAAARAAVSRVCLVLEQLAGEVTILLCDDREALPAINSPSTIPLEAEADLATLRAVITRAEVPGFSCAVKITIPTDPPAQFDERLTDRELAILEGLSSGSTNRELAAHYGISPKTLQNHLTAIYRKIGVVNRGEAIAYVLNRRSG
ncbi:MerR family transcriptional regulator [Mycolicibacterium sp. CH28]|uniref:LuxR C-terminal-related transcriptional regulator n=1 Tax=Mycolicibacterium sp. CH28 TaxID=2512237 RepID=UPI0010802C1E|nr:LuxR C-terminal-related transcriptional regulator [Mycolicibacterium sp. CH28]TGD90771.1 MerR family transcriptional regulator [Mycolicibacterium sp. CH28]